MTTHASSASALSSSPSSRPAAGGRALLARVLRTADDSGPLIARLALGAVMFPHGAQKVLGWFGGYGLAGTMGFFTGQMGIPTVFAALAIAAEFLGSVGLLAGALARVAALGIASTMAVAVLLVHAKVGFFMNWYGAQAGEGFEYHLLAIGLALVVMVRGAGKYSVDRLVTERLDA